MDRKVVILPTASEIIERLRTVPLGNDGYMEEHFYPFITKSAGRELVAMGVVMMFTLAIEDFMKIGYPPIMRSILHTNVPLMIDALVDDKEIAEEAKAFHQKAVEASRQG